MVVYKIANYPVISYREIYILVINRFRENKIKSRSILISDISSFILGHAER